MNPQQYKSGGFREMVAIALPIVVSQACDTVMIFTDRLFLSRLSPELMNATMGGGLTVFMMMSFFIGLTGYSTALVAQYLGAKRKKDCAVVITQAVIFSVLAWLPILACRPLAHHLFEWMGVLSAQLAPQKLYFDILLYGTVITLTRNSLSCFFSGIGRTRIVMTASFTAMVVNAALNYTLIFGKFGFPAMGIRGAAYGTLLGGASGLIVLAAAYLSKRNRAEFLLSRSFRFDWPVASKLLKFGFSPGIELFLNILAFNTMVMTFHSNGLVTATAATIVLNWDMVSFVPLIGIEIGVTSLVGRYMGARDPDTAHRSVLSGIKIGMIYSLLILILFAGFPRQLAEFFRPDIPNTIFTQAIPTAVFMIRLASLYVLVDVLLVVFIGALRGAGDTLWAMGLSVSLHWLMVATIVMALRVFGLSAEAGWTCMVSLFLLFSGVVYLRYRSGKWRSIRVLESEPVVVPNPGFHEPIDL
jgi:MATE family multidrug resistance protein